MKTSRSKKKKKGKIGRPKKIKIGRPTLKSQGKVAIAHLKHPVQHRLRKVGRPSLKSLRLWSTQGYKWCRVCKRVKFPHHGHGVCHPCYHSYINARNAAVEKKQREIERQTDMRI